LRTARWFPALALIFVVVACGGGAPPDLALHLVRDVALPGPAVRFDYQDVDGDARRLYVAHLGANQVDVLDLDGFQLVGTVPNLGQVHGLRLAPDVRRIFATATASDEVVAIDTATLSIVSRTGTGDFPDGAGYDPERHLVAVSNKNDGSETVLDARAGTVLRTIRLGQEVGNVSYDPTSKRMLAAVRPPDELAAFDPATGQVSQRIKLPGCHGAHGVSVDARAHRAFIACEDNARLSVVDLADHRQLSLETVGRDPDVVALDPGLARLYVAAESGVVTVFDVSRRHKMHKLSEGRLASRAHTVAVDPATHRVFFPLENIDGHPVLRVMQP
jgi:DNA-binding beta-propeller fold protein YncE